MKSKHKTFQNRLVESGCSLDPDEFRTLLADVKDRSSRTWSIDSLLIHPADSHVYCDAVRSSISLSEYAMPDSLILGTLLNMRKHKGGRIHKTVSTETD